MDKAEKLSQENTSLRQQLGEAAKSMKAMKGGKIDALVTAHKKGLKVYTQKTADKPYRKLIEKMHEGAVTLNEDGTILYCNSSFANMVNLPLQKVIGTIFADYIDDSSKEHFDELLKHGSLDASKNEVTLFTSDGKEVPVLMTVNTLLLHNSFVLNIILTDLTVLKQNQQRLKRRTKQLEQKNKELEQANTELAFQIEEKEKRETELHIANKELTYSLRLNADKDLFMSILAHDLRSPFNGLLGLSELLVETIHKSDIDTIENLAVHINKSARIAYNLLEDLLMWTRSQSGKIPYERQKISFKDTCAKLLEIKKPNAEAKNITIHVVTTDEITVFADVDMLKTILRNLVSNAIKFTNPGGRIDIGAKQDKTHITITVSDNGIGMAPETVSKLFDGSLYSTRGTANESGTGLGLFLCKEFVKKHGGKIWAESIIGKGTSFHFTLPVEKHLDKPETAGKI